MCIFNIEGEYTVVFGVRLAVVIFYYIIRDRDEAKIDDEPVFERYKRLSSQNKCLSDNMSWRLVIYCYDNL